MKPINVLSLFDGKSCGRIALDRAGIPVKEYYASEVDKYAMQTSKANWPDIKQLGDVRGVYGWMLPKIDLLLGGSPCQGFSFAGKQLNFEDERSKLFFEYVRILKELLERNPDIKFLLENVVMKKEYQKVISDLLGVQPIMINSALLSAQNRKRLYWTNIPFLGQPLDKGIVLRDILEYQVDSKYILSEAGLQRGLNKKYSAPKFNPDKTGTLNTKNNSGQLSIDSGTVFVSVEQNNKSLCLSASYMNNPSIRDYEKSQKQLILCNINPSQKGQNGQVYDINKKGPALSTNKGEGSKIGLRIIGLADDISGFENNRRVYSEEGKAPTLISSAGGHKEPKVGINQINPDKDAAGKQPYMQDRIFDVDYKSHALTAEFAARTNAGSILQNGITYRKLTVTECERLQTVPDGYCQRVSATKKQVSNSQAYKMLGNGWTIDVIVWLLYPLLPSHDFLFKNDAP